MPRDQLSVLGQDGGFRSSVSSLEERVRLLFVPSDVRSSQSNRNTSGARYTGSLQVQAQKTTIKYYITQKFEYKLHWDHGGILFKRENERHPSHCSLLQGLVPRGVTLQNTTPRASL